MIRKLTRPLVRPVTSFGNVDPSPTYWWNFSLDDPGNGTTTANDRSGSNHGTLTNMDPGTDWVADTDSGGVRAISFDGSNDHITTATTLSSSDISKLTLALWFKTGSSATGRQMVGTDALTRGFSFRQNNGAPELFASADGTPLNFHRVTSTTSYKSAWHHAAIVFDAGTMTMYVDGSVQATNNTSVGTPGSVINGGGAIDMGSRDGIASSFYAGLLDDVRVYLGTALTAPQVATLATSRT